MLIVSWHVKVLSPDLHLPFKNIYGSDFFFFLQSFSAIHTIFVYSDSMLSPASKHIGRKTGKQGWKKNSATGLYRHGLN